jgi:CRP-like cAMP-binding protein
MLSRPDPTQNRLLAALDADSYARLLPRLEPAWMPSGLELKTSAQLGYVYFPTSCIVSLIYVMENGDTSAVASVGNEGLVGLYLFFGGHSTSILTMVHNAGSSYRIKTKDVKAEYGLQGNFQHLITRYAQAHMAHIAQTAACNRHHSIEQQLCCWLLLSVDRLGSDEVVITQGLIAHILGVHRERVTAAASKLQTEGIIQCGRGRIHVLDRSRLEKRVCECYAAFRKEFDYWLPRGRVTLRTARSAPYSSQQIHKK